MAEPKKHLTDEQIEAKRIEIETREKQPIRALCFIAEGQQIVGFLKDAPRITKKRAFDKMLMSITDAAQILLDAMLLKEDSDPRLSSDKSEDDKINLSACLAVQDVLLPYTDTLKKN